MAGRCKLVSLNKSHEPIPLPHLKAVIIGRNTETCIEDTKVSRKQVQLIANVEDKTVSCTRLGSQQSFIDGNVIERGKAYKFRPRETLTLYKQKYPYCINFEPQKNSKEKSGEIGKGVKRVASSSITDSVNMGHSKKKIKCDDETKPSNDSQRDDSSDEENESVKEKLANMKRMFAEQKSKKHESEAERLVADEYVENIQKERTGKAASNYTKEGLFVYNSESLIDSSKIAAFDIDNTIICTKSGRVFPVDIADWKILYPEVKKKLRSLHKDGYKVVFFTNQSGIKRGKLKVNDFKNKLAEIIEECDIPIQVFTSTGSGFFRKPALGMWNYLQEEENGNIKIDKTASFYIGDAAGRPVKWAPGKKKDFSCSDRLFALNIGIHFQTPEEYFLKYKKADFSMPDFDPRKLSINDPLCKPATAQITVTHQEIVVFVGFPASGKSYFAKHHLVPHGYVHVNRDSLGSWQKCVSACENAARKKQSVVVDNTNPDKESRQRYLKVAKSLGIACRCFYFNATLQQCKHNERYRELTDSSHQKINDMIMNSFKSKFSEPSVKEGFNDVIQINFVPTFKDSKSEELFRMFLV